MNSIDDFVTLLNDELGMTVTAEDVGRSLDEVPGWDSVHLLWMHTALERATGQSISMPELLEATSLAGIYQLAAPR